MFICLLIRQDMAHNTCHLRTETRHVSTRTLAASVRLQTETAEGGTCDIIDIVY